MSLPYIHQPAGGTLSTIQTISNNQLFAVAKSESRPLELVYKRHGRTDLVPLPSDFPDDPLNWPSWRKNVLLFIVAFHVMQGPFGSAMLIPSYEELSVEFHTRLSNIPYLSSVQIAFFGVMPLFWSPISSRIGRRPVYLVSALISAAMALAGGFCHSYGTLMATRVLQAIFISPAQSIGASTVHELFFEHEKGAKMGAWTLCITCGPLLAPLVSGFLVQYEGWRSSFYLLAAIHLTLFFAHFFFGQETLYLNRGVPGKILEQPGTRMNWKNLFTFHVYDRKPFTITEIYRPLVMIVRPVVLLPAIVYAFVMAYTNVTMTLNMPQLFVKLFRLTPGKVGLQFIALLVGGFLGEQLGGRGSDWLVRWRTKRNGGTRLPEYRLGLALPGLAMCIAGLIVWGVQLQNATPGRWNVTPDVGSGIAIFGQQVIATVCYTYPVESYPTETADVSVFIALLRNLYMFAAPFYLARSYASLGPAKAAGIFSSVMGFSMLLVIACIIWGPVWRRAANT